MAGGATIAVVGYASLDLSTSTRQFRGVDATTILERAIVSAERGVGGVAHLANAVCEAGAQAEVISWVGNDPDGQRWTASVAREGSGTRGVATAGNRTPSATLVEIGSGGTICLFDPGDCHGDTLTDEQVDVITGSEWVLLTVAPRHFTTQLLDALPATTHLVWAVKHDEDAYTAALVRRILERADVVSFSRGERHYLALDGVQPEQTARAGSLVIETRGADGVAWSVASTTRHGRLPVEPVDVDDTTGAGDTFVGALVSLASHLAFETLTDEEITTLVRTAATAAGDMLRRRTLEKEIG